MARFSRAANFSVSLHYSNSITTTIRTMLNTRGRVLSRMLERNTVDTLTIKLAAFGQIHN